MPKQEGSTFEDPKPEDKLLERKDLDQEPDSKKAPKKDDKAIPEVPLYDGDIEKYKGKNPEELVKMLEDQHSYLGKVTAERDKFKGDLDYVDRVQRFVQEPEAEPQVEEKPDEETDSDYVSRGQMKDTVKKALEEDRKARQAETQQKLTTMAAYAHEEGKASLTKNPELYQGIEKETEMGVFQTLKPYLEAGYDVSGYLRDPATWERVGRQIRFNRGEYDLLQKVDGKKRPASSATVTPVEGEIPAAGRADEDDTPKGDVKLDAKGRYIADYFGLTEEEAVKGVRDKRKERNE